MIDEKKKKKRRLLWLLLIFFLLAGLSGVIVAGVINHESPRNSEKKVIPEVDLEQKKREAEQVINEVFCYCSLEDIQAAFAIAAEHNTKSNSPIIETVGAQECLAGFYDHQKDIAYQSSIFTRDNFHDPKYDIDGRINKYQYRDFYLKNGVVTYNLYNLDSEQYYNKPIIWRIHHPSLYDDVSDTNYYNDVSGQPDYAFIRYDDRSLSWGWTANEVKFKLAVMVQTPISDCNMTLEECAEITGIDLSKFIFIDIK